MGEIIVTNQGGAPGSLTDLARVRSGQSVKDEWAAPWDYPTITKGQVQTWGQACTTMGISGVNVGEKWYYGQPGKTSFNTLLTPNSKFPNCSFHCNGCAFDGGGMYGARSKHSGGVHVLLADGSARFISENLDWDTYQRLGSRNDGLPTGEF
jgi:prepilin-type processing-associated H-X9-DG protein